MTQREYANDGDTNRKVVYNTTPEPVYETAPIQQPAAQTYSQPVPQPARVAAPVYNHAPAATYETPHVDVENTIVTPTDRIRWGPILAGLFAALSTLALLSLLGLAIGASNVDAGDNARNFGLGAGIWGGLSALLAFLLGGWLAAHTAAVRGERNGMLNGAMVWAIAIPLLLWLLTSGIGSALRTAGNVAATGAQVAGQVTDGNVNAPEAQDAAGNAVTGAQDQIQNLATPQNIENAADATRRGALGTLGSLLLGLGAASLGGYLGSRTASGRRGFREILG